MTHIMTSKGMESLHSHVYSGAAAAAVIAAREENRNSLAMTSHVTNTAIATGQAKPNNTPNAVATPLPP